MGGPVVALRGERHSARVGASLLSAAGQPQWIAETPQDYVEIARSLAGARPPRADVKDALFASRLMDAERHVSKLENAYRNIWKRYLEANG